MPAVHSIEALRDALSSPDAYPHDPDRLTLEQTHISLVAIVPPRVYKVKKPVDLGFLDFSTLADRKHYCEAEVRLNRRLCEGTYVGVVPVVETPNGLRVDPEQVGERDEVVEYAVKMNYLDPDHFLDRTVKRGTATTADVDRVARTLCTFYESRSSTPAVAEAGWIENLRVSTEENFQQTAEQVGSALTRPAYEALRYYTDRFFDHHAALFHRRRAGGHIVDGHGDLRLEHVHLTDERVCIYDCIEFNERFRHLDVANDVAFLAMDLDYCGRPDLARRLVRRVATTLDDPELSTLIDFYKCYRAYVRGKVEGMRAGEAEVPPAERGQSRVRAHRFYQWALRYAVAGSEPLVIVVFGRSGTGKSTQATALARSLGWPHVASDRVRKTFAGVPLRRRTREATRKSLYSEMMSDVTYETLRERALDHARQRQGTILDATYSDPARRASLRSALRDAGVSYVFVELTAPDDVLRRRLSTRTEESATASDARAEDFGLLDARYQAPSALEDPRHVRIDTQDDPQDTTLAVLKALIRLND
jgi:hypothetical protein